MGENGKAAKFGLPGSSFRPRYRFLHHLRVFLCFFLQLDLFSARFLPCSGPFPAQGSVWESANSLSLAIPIFQLGGSVRADLPPTSREITERLLTLWLQFDLEEDGQSELTPEEEEVCFVPRSLDGARGALGGGGGAERGVCNIGRGDGRVQGSKKCPG